MSAAPRFSVVIPAYNAVKTIGATVRSVFSQPEGSFELIIVDDGSSDGTPDLVRELSSELGPIHLIEQENQGVAGARNTGINASGAKYVAFVDNDDLWMPTYLEDMGAALDAYEDAGFAFTDAYLLDDGCAKIQKVTSLNHHPPLDTRQEPEVLLHNLIVRNFVMSSVMARRAALESGGYFERLVNGVDDWDLWLRLAVDGWGAARADRPVLIQRDRLDSQSKDEVMMLSRSEIVLMRVIDDERYPEWAHEMARSRLEDIQVRLRRELSYGPVMTAVRARRMARRARNRMLPDSHWLAALPADVAAAFPDLEARYGEPRSNAA